MRVVLIGHRFVDQPRGGGYAWGLAQAGVELEVVKVGRGAAAQPIPELPNVPVSAIVLPERASGGNVTVTEKPHRPGWYVIRQRDEFGRVSMTQTQTPPRSLHADARERLARTIGDDHGILLKGVQFDPEDVAWLAQRVDMTYVLVDVASPLTVERGRHCARVIVTGPEAVAAFERHGRPTRCIIQGWRPHVWAPSTPAPSVLPQIAFTGSDRSDRAVALTELKRAGLTVVRRAAWLRDAAEFYRESAVTLCPHNCPAGRNSFSNRLVRVVASGGMPLHAWTPSVAATFPDVPTYRSMPSMIARARSLLAEASDVRRARLDRMRDAVQPYTWDKVAHRWLDFIREAPRAARMDGADRETRRK